MNRLIIILSIAVSFLLGYFVCAYNEDNRQEIIEQNRADSIAQENYKSMID